MKNPQTIPELSEYPGVITLPIQWGDQDPFDHVNNVIYFRWFESARIDYLNLLDIDGFSVETSESHVRPILASIRCDYRKQLKFPDTAHIGTRVAKMGNSSVQIVHGLYSESHAAIAATAESTIVVFDYDANKPVRAPDQLREAIRACEGRDDL